MTHALLEKLVGRRIIAGEEIDEIVAACGESWPRLEALLAARGVPRHELLHGIAEAHGRPFVEYDEGIGGAKEALKQLGPERLKRGLWFPVSVRDGTARVIASDPAAAREVKDALGVSQVELSVALPSDVVRIIENSFDLNPGFPPSGGRTPLAKVRTYLAGIRSSYACTRTSLARGRTGLAILRTGFSFVTIALVLHRIFGIGILTILEAALAAVGVYMVAEGFRWYLPARRSARQKLACDPPAGSGGTTVLQASSDDDGVTFTRSDPVEGSAELRAGWSDLSPVMRRRFLASDRTDLAEERTYLACLRTRMARARTGLAFTRTGIASVGLGIALFRMRQFQIGPWPLFDGLLLLVGGAMILEGFLWYFMDRSAGAEGHESVKSSTEARSIWEDVFPPRHERPSGEAGPARPLPLWSTQAPGIWATTGLALERTVLAERRNVMARLRTVMARSRTGMAFIRTGVSIFAVGGGLLVYFGASNLAWAAVDVFFLVAGFLLVADGLWWHLPAEKVRRQFPYCYCDFEIADPDYGRPACDWGKAVFSHDGA